MDCRKGEIRRYDEEKGFRNYSEDRDRQNLIEKSIGEWEVAKNTSWPSVLREALVKAALGASP